MKIQIKHRWTGALIFECDGDSMKLAVELAVSRKVSLSGANLSCADLSGANLSCANLSAADLSGANLRAANLRYANLSAADLSGANLRAANLRYANLSGADLSGANLRAADLSAANLRYANLSAANLSDANLSDANLRDANLSDANLRDANLRYANLSAADLSAANARLPTGETYEEYLRDVVPALLTAGGKPLESFREHWQCHDWTNCPMAHAFDVHSIGEIPVLLRPRADQFVQLFDAGQIPVSVLDVPQQAAAK